MKLLLFLPAVRAGGAERVMTTLAEDWAANGHEIYLATVNKTRDFYELSNRIHRIRLDQSFHQKGVIGALRGNLGKLSQIRRTVKEVKPQAVISFLNLMNIRVLLACAGLKVPVVISERIAPERTSAGRLWRMLRRFTYPSASLIVCQTQRESDWFTKYNGNRTVIPNPLKAGLPPVSSLPSMEKREKKIVAMGRLTPQKGFLTLISVYARLSAEYPDWNLEIYGDGSQREACEKLVKEFSMENCISLPGVTENPGDIMSRSALFVLPSRYEGFPNVLVEAMSLGCAVAAFDCPNGPGEIIKDGTNGLLVADQDERELESCLRRMMGNADLRKRLGNRGAEQVREEYASRRITNLWKTELEKLCT